MQPIKLCIIKQKSMIKHLLLLQYKQNADQKQIDDILDKFAGLKLKIDGIKSIDYGANKNPKKLNKNFTHAAVLHSPVRVIVITIWCIQTTKP